MAIIGPLDFGNFFRRRERPSERRKVEDVRFAGPQANVQAKARPSAKLAQGGVGSDVGGMKGRPSPLRVQKRHAPPADEEGLSDRIMLAPSSEIRDSELFRQLFPTEMDRIETVAGQRGHARKPPRPGFERRAGAGRFRAFQSLPSVATATGLSTDSPTSPANLFLSGLAHIGDVTGVDMVRFLGLNPFEGQAIMDFMRDSIEAKLPATGGDLVLAIQAALWDIQQEVGNMAAAEQPTDFGPEAPDIEQMFADLIAGLGQGGGGGGGGGGAIPPEPEIDPLVLDPNITNPGAGFGFA